PLGEGRTPIHLRRKGRPNEPGKVGRTLCLLLNQYGQGVGWKRPPGHGADNTLQWLIRQCEERMIVLSDTAFHAAWGDPTNLKLCQRGSGKIVCWWRRCSRC